MAGTVSHAGDGVDVAIVGAGVVGVACGAALARSGRSVVVLERHGRTGLETTSRNSEVIHAGLYYPTGSLKATTCVEGRERLYARCAAEGLPHRRTGKLVVATCEEEVATLENIAARAAANGVTGLETWDATQVARREPRVRGHAGLWVPVSGIVDAHALVDSYHAELERHDGSVVTHTEVTGLERRASGWRVHTKPADGEGFSLDVTCVVNAAGLSSDRVAELAGIDVDAADYRLHPCKGDYFSVAPALGVLSEALVYPVPAGPGLGIHVTLDLGGRFRLGPDTSYVENVAYDVDPNKAEAFARAAARYLPEIRAEHLSPDYAGVRPKLAGPGVAFRDFVIEEESARGAPGLVNLIGIESPGLTAAGAIAERVVSLLS